MALVLQTDVLWAVAFGIESYKKYHESFLKYVRLQTLLAL
jgi:hypothetical protein